MTSQRSISDRKILVVDDEVIMVDIVTAHLNRAGFWNIIGISDPLDVISIIPRESPDLMLVDVSMPNLSGHELIELVRQDPVTSHLPVVVVTGTRDPQAHKRAMELGASEVVTKPIRPERLLKAVSAALGGASGTNTNSKSA
ncbi:MAG: response regulator [Planctomycetota bacterium]